ncbi:CaiB/BaiF CoA transferase family protein [Sphingomonas oryzagri]
MTEIQETSSSMVTPVAGGPLTGVRVIEFGGIGPGPHCGMILGDLGADVIRVDRPGEDKAGTEFDLLNRNKRSIALDLKSNAGIGTARHLVDRADLLIEGFRPKVMEKLGLGPEAFETSNPKLVYGRMTGWGQSGPLAQAAGHDLNYIALTGALYALGHAGERPTVPLNLVGDFGGGSLYLAVGLLAALHQAQRSGRGQVIDCAIVDGVNNMLAMQHGMIQQGDWTLDRASNLIDGGAPFYDVYETSDGQYISIGPVEPKFYRLFLDLVEIDPAGLPAQYDKSGWPILRQRFTQLFASKTRDEWCALLEGTDVCFAPVLRFDEARQHPHNRAREMMIDMFGLEHPAPAPRFSRTPGGLRYPPSIAGRHSAEITADWEIPHVPGTRATIDEQP